MLEIDNLNYASDMTIIFQRLSVMCTDIVYAIGVKMFIESVKFDERNILGGLLLSNIGLFFIDHIHFQYNGILFGILLLSISRIQREKYLQSALLFAVLLNMKHIFIYIAPAFVAYLLKFYCLRSGQPIVSLVKLAGIVLGVLTVSLGPFVNHLPQLLSRLFPFKRGLCHAYWAPNFWALYNVVDKGIAIALKVKLPVNGTTPQHNTGGLVQEFQHQVLPSIPPSVTFLLTAVAMLPAIVKLMSLNYDRILSPKHFIRTVTLCACTSFMFGWHVHEKAILMVLIPLSLLSTSYRREANATLFLSIVAGYSLLPLLHTQELLEVKLLFLFIYITFLFIGLHEVHRSNGGMLLQTWEIIYLTGFPFVFLYENVIQYLFKLNEKLPFMPLLLISFYCSLGVCYFWIRYYIKFLSLRNDNKDNLNSVNENVTSINKRKKIK